MNVAQNMYVWRGIQLIGSTASERKGIKNGVLYTVTDIHEDDLVLDGNITVAFDQVKQLLRLSYAITYAACQGSEFEGTLRLWDTDNRHFTRQHLFVGLSRAKRADEVSLI